MMGKTWKPVIPEQWEDPLPKYMSGFGMCKKHKKVWFGTRSQAKKFIRYRFAHERMNAYRCGRYWHIGHLVPAARAGLATRDGKTWLGAPPTNSKELAR